MLCLTPRFSEHCRVIIHSFYGANAMRAPIDQDEKPAETQTIRIRSTCTCLMSTLPFFAANHHTASTATAPAGSFVCQRDPVTGLLTDLYRHGACASFS